MHGFDEFFGNLYHLNAEEEPENIDYPKDPDLQGRLRAARRAANASPRRSDTPGEDPRFGTWGKQKCEDTGPLTQKRMETVDQEFLDATLDFIDRANRDNKPFFVWFNSSRMHIWTHLTPEAKGKTGLGVYPDGMVEHDGQVGQLLKQLDDLEIADDTIVIYTTDNGAEVMSWPDGGTTPFRGEKNTNWEGGYRVPAMVRWPGLVKPGTEINDVFSAEDWMQTLMAAVGEPDLRRSSSRAPRRRQDLQGASRRLRPARSAGERQRWRRARNSSTGPTTAAWPACATTSGSSRSWSSAPTASTSGRIRW